MSNSINIAKLRLEDYGAKKQWVMTDRDEEKCHWCAKIVSNGMYCPESDRFWCMACEEKARRSKVTFPCRCLVFNTYHDIFKVICTMEKKKGVNEDGV